MKKTTTRIVFLLAAILLAGCGEPEDVNVTIELPLNVSQGDEFVIVATVKNTSSDQQELVSLDIADGYLDGIAILRTEPNHSEATHIPLDNTMSYVFELPVGAGEQKEIKLYAKAVRQGDYNAEIDFCINSEFSFLSRSIRTIVE